MISRNTFRRHVYWSHPCGNLQALRKCQLSDIVKLLPLRLDSPGTAGLTYCDCSISKRSYEHSLPTHMMFQNVSLWPLPELSLSFWDWHVIDWQCWRTVRITVWDKGSCSVWAAHFWSRAASWCWMKPRRPWTRRRTLWSKTQCEGSLPTAPSSALLTAFLPSWTVTKCLSLTKVIKSSQRHFFHQANNVQSRWKSKIMASWAQWRSFGLSIKWVVLCFVGKMKEYDSPAKLMEVQPESIFAALVHEYQARSESNTGTREIK